MANGEEQRRAAELESQRTADQRLTDSGISEEPRESVLERGRRAPSYAFAEPPPPEPMAGGGMLESPGMELERQRAAEERMRQTAEAALGGPEVARKPAQEERAGAAPEGARAPGVVGPSKEAGTEETEEEEIDRAALLRQHALLADREREKQAATENAKQQTLEQNQLAYDMAKIGSAGTFFGPPVIMAYQTIREYFFPSPIVPKARFEEKMGCFTFFFAFIFGWLFSPPFFIGVFLLLVFAVVYLLK